MTESNHIRVALSFGLMLSFVFPAIVRTQGQSTPRFSIEIGRLIKRKEPEWRYSQGFCTCPPLLPSQLADEVATWERKRANGTRERVGMMIVTIGSKTEAIDFMKGFASGRWQGHSRVQKYQIGDEAFLQDYSEQNTSNNTKIANPIQVWIRKGNFVLNIDGELPGTVIRFAQYALAALPRD